MSKLLLCPNCRAPMDRRQFERHVHGDVQLDICWTCQVIWFDKFESAQLAPGSVIALFKLIHEHRADTIRTSTTEAQCPRCTTLLVLTNDMQRNNRIRYYRCPNGHGRLTAFMQFLREKDFVRSLSTAEIESLKATVTQVQCSSCGAAIDLARDTACSFCRAPIAVLDGAAVERAMRALAASDQKSKNPDAAHVAAAVASVMMSKRTRPEDDPWIHGAILRSTPASLDLVAGAIALLFEN